MPLWQLVDCDRAMHYPILYLEKTDEGGTTGSYCPLPPSFEMEEEQSPPQSLAASSIASERTTFWSIRPRLKSTKNWSSDSHRSSRHSFEWIASGFTVVCFWTALRRWIAALEGPVRFRLALDSTLARLSPNRCLAGPPGPSC